MDSPRSFGARYTCADLPDSNKMPARIAFPYVQRFVHELPAFHLAIMTGCVQFSVQSESRCKQHYVS